MFDPEKNEIVETEKNMYGVRDIANNKLESWPNPHPDLDIPVAITLPEFTCLCPRSGYPDFATIIVEYIPDKFVVELKTIKLYINQFRDVHISHEATPGKIYKDLRDLLHPKRLRVIADFTPRGNVHTVTSVDSEEQTNKLPIESTSNNI